MKKRLCLWICVLAAILLFIPVTAGCGGPAPAASLPAAAPEPSPAASPAVTPAPAPPGGPQEGIKVHGHWTIEVKNPDGTLVEQRDFENALVVPDGSTTLALLLGRQASAGGWAILVGPGSTPPWVDTGGFPALCQIVESTYTSESPAIFKSLVVTVPSSGVNQNKLVLSGTATAQNNGDIGGVGTAIVRLNAVSPPASSYAQSYTPFTEKWLDSAINILAGQMITVTVVISFS